MAGLSNAWKPANNPTPGNIDLASEHLDDASKFDPRKKDFNEESGKTSFGTRTPTTFQNVRDKVQGPVDPLTGRVDPDAVDYNQVMQLLVYQDSQLRMAQQHYGKMSELISATLALQPILPCLVDGGNNAVFSDNPKGRSAGYLITNLESREFRFSLEGKRVPALKLIIQNKGLDYIWINFNAPATQGSLRFPPNSEWESEICVESLGVISNLANIIVNGPADGGIFIGAWSNPEWAHVKGQV